jgi:hypothetical protein
MFFPITSSLIDIYTHIKKFYPRLLKISPKKKKYEEQGKDGCYDDGGCGSDNIKGSMMLYNTPVLRMHTMSFLASVKASLYVMTGSLLPLSDFERYCWIIIICCNPKEINHPTLLL